MPPCICGLKVDRNQEKLICFICNQLFHPECCNYKPEEVVFAKNIFKCSACIRRTPSSNDNSQLDKSNNAVKEVEDVQILTAITADCASGSDLPLSLDIPLDSSALLELLLKEFAVVKASNSQLCEEVSALRKENSSLLVKVSSLESSVNQLKNAVGSSTAPSSESSPKRKKINSNKANQTPKGLSNNVFNFPMLSKNGACGVTSGLNNSPSGAIRSYASVSRPLFPVAVDTTAPLNDGGWNTVLKKVVRTPVTVTRNSRKPLVVGQGTNNDLNVVDKKKWLHLSSFKNSVNTEDIISFVEKHFGISSSHLICYKLVKKDIDVSGLKHVNFKLGVSACFVEKLFDASLWPANIKIRYFNFLEKAVELK